MKAMVIHRFGEPEVMQWEDPPTPGPGPGEVVVKVHSCLLYTSPSPRDGLLSRMPSSA